MAGHTLVFVSCAGLGCGVMSRVSRSCCVLLRPGRSLLLFLCSFLKASLCFCSFLLVCIPSGFVAHISVHRLQPCCRRAYCLACLHMSVYECSPHVRSCIHFLFISVAGIRLQTNNQAGGLQSRPGTIRHHSIRCNKKRSSKGRAWLARLPGYAGRIQMGENT